MGRDGSPRAEIRPEWIQIVPGYLFNLFWTYFRQKKIKDHKKYQKIEISYDFLIIFLLSFPIFLFKGPYEI